MEVTEKSWKVIAGTIIQIDDEDGHLIGSTFESLPTFEQCRENAHLIAYAPQLYRALKDCVELLSYEAPQDAIDILREIKDWNIYK